MHLDPEIKDYAPGDGNRCDECCREMDLECSTERDEHSEKGALITLKGSYDLTQLCLAWVILIYRGSLGLDKDDTVIRVVPDSLYNEENLDCKGTMSCRIGNLVFNKAIFASDVSSAIKEKLIAHVKGTPGYVQNERWYFVAYSDNMKNDRYTWRIDAVDNEHRVTAWKQNLGFSKSSVSLQLRVYQDILERISSSTYLKVDDFKSASSAEVEQHKSWTGEEAIQTERCMHDLFSERALSSPNQPAVVSWDGSFTYGELDCLSKAFAHSLDKRGLCNGDIVPVCFEKSAWTVVAVLAILKVGAAFTLTDPQQPISRLKTIVDEVSARYIITSPRCRELGHELTGSSKVIVLDGPTLRNKIPDDLFTPPTVDPYSPMYIIFTSGSTGKPKGVIINHVNYTSGAVRRADIVGYQQNTRVLDFASYAFDVSIDCMLLTLATGGCFCVPSEDERMNDLSNAIRRMKVNMVHTTPSIAHVLDPDIIPSLDVLGLGGEAVPARLASEWSAVTRVLVAYGPSECTVGCAFSVHDKDKAYTSLGKGCGGSLWVVDQDDHDKLSPIGAVGELIVSGPVVGPGYINQHEATGRVFVENPKWLSSIRDGNGKQRFYKTGDLVRYDPDGSGAVVFIGRKDSQVKIRGQRVELEEVEHHLRQRLATGATVVAEVIYPAKSNSPVLVAFIATNSETTKTACDTKPVHDPEFMRFLPEMVSDLQANVPKYMVPSAFIPLQRVPMMVSGKTDRKCLRNIGASLSWQDLATFGPKKGSDARQADCQSTELESTLGELWSRVLGTELELEPQSNFFSKGGDSLKAMRLVAAARASGFALSVKSVFAFPTLARMASHLEAARTSNEEYLPFSLLNGSEDVQKIRDDAARLCGIQSESVQDIYPCTPLQEALMALSAKNSEAYIAQRLLNFNDEQTADDFCNAFKRAILQTPVLRTRIVHLAGHGLLQVVTHEEETNLIVSEEQGYLEADGRQGMQLGDRLIRAALVTDRMHNRTFVLTMHHAIYDGWSIPLFVSRINRICRDTHMAAPPNFALFVRHLMHTDRGKSEEYWRTALEGAVAYQFPALPFPEYQTQADALLEHHTACLHSSQSKITLASKIRAAWAATVAEHTGNADIIFGETLTGRNAAVPGIEAIEGPCITTVPLRLNVNTGMSCEEFLNLVQETTVGRMPHEHFGLQHIRKLTASTYAACELRTGIVLHPKSEDDDNATWVNGPADGLVPVNDSEAAKEALQFNSYALMLVVTPTANGFLIMASFDSNVLAVQDLQTILTRFDEVFRIFFNDSSQKLSDIVNLPAIDKVESPKNGYNDQPYTNGIVKDTADHSTSLDEVSSDPEDSKEARLKRLWTNLLGTPQAAISEDTSFFEIGGDSISAMKLVSELRSEGYSLTVQDVFAHRQLDKISAVLKTLEQSPITTHHATQAAHKGDHFVSSETGIRIRGLLQDADASPISAYRARPLQEIAVRGSTQLPRYSMRYELFHFSNSIDKERIKNACRELVWQNEILRTNFVNLDDQCLAVVVREPQVEIAEYSIEHGIGQFAQDLVDLDIRISVPMGSQFVRFWLILSTCGDACLVTRLSHAQYDEMCLPLMWQQLKLLYEGQSLQTTKPFSAFSEHVTEKNVAEGIPYWRELLRGSQMSILPGPSRGKPVQNDLMAVSQAVSIKDRTKRFTVATLPTAAWALCLARRLSTMDVTFGEVVSGRQIDFADADKVIGPCWQYVPTRIQFQPTWRVKDLLQSVQSQHIASSRYEGMGLSEIIEHCTDWPEETSSFDSVVHQAVAATEQMNFGGSECRVETCYPHAEPLREWKVQAFVDKEVLTLEIVTFREWEDFGAVLLNDLVGCFEQLLGDEDLTLFCNQQGGSPPNYS